MKEVVVTGWHPEGEELYGFRMASTFATFWPESVDFLTYVEKEPNKLQRGEYRLLKDIPGWKRFFETWRKVPEARGCPGPLRPQKGKPGYDFHWDAVKWARQAFIPWDAAIRFKGEGLLVWLDGDVYTHAHVPPSFLSKIMGDTDVAYLGRGRVYPEIGFQGYRLPQALPFLEKWRDLYATGDFVSLSEWHSAFTWWTVFKRKDCKLRITNLSQGPMDASGNIWHQSSLDLYTKHLKGYQKHQK